jgi:serine/threonine protein phosphatase 1
MSLTIYAVGDIHGRDDCLRLLHAEISAHARSQPGEKLLVYVGDYVDRGPDSADVVDRVMAGPPEDIDRQVTLMGNHEEMMLAYYSRQDDFKMFLFNGGDKTIRSYGNDKERLHRHLNWMSELPLYYREGRYLFVHAGIWPGRPIEKQRPADLLWIRNRFLDDTRDHGCIVVHGHTPIPGRPEVRPNRINTDAMAFDTGRLCCAVLGEDDLLGFLWGEA